MNFIHHRSYAESIVGTQEDQRESFQTREIITICEWIRLSLSMNKAITEHICQMLNVIYWNGVPFLSCKWNKRENDKLSSANTVSNQISTNTPLCAFIRRDVRHCPRHFNDNSQHCGFTYQTNTGKDREAWCAAVHGVAKSWTWLSDWTTPTQCKIMCHHILIL